MVSETGVNRSSPDACASDLHSTQAGLPSEVPSKRRRVASPSGIQTPGFPLWDLPPELLLTFMTHLDAPATGKLCCTCTTSRDLLETSEGWLELCERHWEREWGSPSSIDKWHALLGSGQKLASLLMTLNSLLQSWKAWELATFRGLSNQYLTLDLEEGQLLFRIFKEEGRLPALNRLGVMYYREGGNPRRDVEKARRLFQMCAEEGFAPAQANLGEWYLSSDDQQDYFSALFWLVRAESQGNVRAKFSLGLLAEEDTIWIVGLRRRRRPYGLLGAENLEKSLPFLRGAAESGYAPAQCKLGHVLYGRRGATPSDFQEAAQLLQQSLEKPSGNGIEGEAGNDGQYICGHERDWGRVQALKLLAECYMRGRGVPRSLRKDEDMRWEAAIEGDIESICSCAHVYESAHDITGKYEKIYQVYGSANLVTGSPVTQHRLGQRYRRGRGVPQDDARAIQLFEAAMNQNFIPAFLSLAVCYLQSTQPPTNAAQARTLCQRARDLRKLEVPLGNKIVRQSWVKVSPSSAGADRQGSSSSRESCSGAVSGSRHAISERPTAGAAAGGATAATAIGTASAAAAEAAAAIREAAAAITGAAAATVGAAAAAEGAAGAAAAVGAAEAVVGVAAPAPAAAARQGEEPEENDAVLAVAAEQHVQRWHLMWRQHRHYRQRWLMRPQFLQFPQM
eukprot:TRINITY_DN10194_c0_g2_i1.p1 TRINITY_DN10194_c0_g2~~TRINITY_DN10194_c0_g2_i1.p1  ORF type:complete len:679 (-),score=115.33 TRINITY_DN10194_c0_g2_i1:335-2371(-)